MKPMRVKKENGGECCIYKRMRLSNNPEDISNEELSIWLKSFGINHLLCEELCIKQGLKWDLICELKPNHLSDMHAGLKDQLILAKIIKIYKPLPMLIEASGAARKYLKRDLWERGLIKPDERSTRLLRALRDTTEIIALSNEIKVLKLGYNFHTNNGIAPTDLFIRGFYPSLLDKILINPISMIVGNPGLGKSMFHYYILACLVNPNLFQREKGIFKVVVRQIGNSHFVIMILETCEAFITYNVESFILRSLDSDTTLYLFKPDQTKEQKPFNICPNMHLVGTVSPNDGRYKETMKLPGALMFYFPLWEKKELVTLANYVVTSSSSDMPKYLQEFYSEEQTESRFEEFNGVLRSVLPDSPQKLDDIRRLRDEAITNVSMEAVMIAGNIESKEVPHFVAKMIVPRTGPLAFRTFALDIVSSFVMDKLEARWRAVDLSVKRSMLIRNEETGYMADLCPKLFEDVIHRTMISPSGVKWKARVVEVTHTSIQRHLVDFDVKCIDIVEGKPPFFKDMKQRVIYYSLNPTHRAVESIIKLKKDSIMFLQMKWLEGTSVKPSPRLLNGIINTYKIKKGTNIEYSLFTKSKMALKTKIEVDESSEELNPEYNWKWQVVHIPSTYK